MGIFLCVNLFRLTTFCYLSSCWCSKHPRLICFWHIYSVILLLTRNQNLGEKRNVFELFKDPILCKRGGRFCSYFRGKKYPNSQVLVLLMVGPLDTGFSLCVVANRHRFPTQFRKIPFPTLRTGLPETLQKSSAEGFSFSGVKKWIREKC